MMYLIFCIQILCDGKVVSPVTYLLHSVVQMCTVRPWGTLSPGDSNPREVPHLNATIGAVFCELSSIQVLKLVGKFPLRALGRDKTEIWQHCLILSESTVLNLHCDWLSEFAGCWDPEDRAQEIWVLRKLILPSETCFDIDPDFSHTKWQTSFWNMEFESISLPYKAETFTWNCKPFLSNYFHSFDRICSKNSSDI